jgi:CDP-diacylglycerol---glycerol-3-phosphate 3-phosphatidyltransferase
MGKKRSGLAPTSEEGVLLNPGPEYHDPDPNRGSGVPNRAGLNPVGGPLEVPVDELPDDLGISLRGGRGEAGRKPHSPTVGRLAAPKLTLHLLPAKIRQLDGDEKALRRKWRLREVHRNAAFADVDGAPLDGGAVNLDANAEIGIDTVMLASVLFGHRARSSLEVTSGVRSLARPARNIKILAVKHKCDGAIIPQRYRHRGPEYPLIHRNALFGHGIEVVLHEGLRGDGRGGGGPRGAVSAADVAEQCELTHPQEFTTGVEQRVLKAALAVAEKSETHGFLRQPLGVGGGVGGGHSDQREQAGPDAGDFVAADGHRRPVHTLKNDEHGWRSMATGRRSRGGGVRAGGPAYDPPVGGGGLNAALVVTWSRVALIPALMVFLLVDDIPGGLWWAFGIWVAAVGTDWVDGRLARSRGQVTILGVFLDSLADKLLVSAALVALIETGDIAAWAAMIIISREFAVTGLRMVAASEDLIIPASRLGKWKMVSQSVALAVIIAPIDAAWVDDVLLDVALVLTVLSGAYYFLMARRRLFTTKPAGYRPGGHE